MEPYIFNPWVYRDPLLGGGYSGTTPDVEPPRREDLRVGSTDDGGPGFRVDLVGYAVEAVDGGVGKVDQASDEAGAAHLVVDTGPWIFGRKVLLPAGVVDRVDHSSRTVFVDRSKDQIKDSPEYDGSGDDAYRARLADYYRETYRANHRTDHR